jgi:hypothetical protein
MLQEIIVYLIVLAAAAYLARMVWSAFVGSGGGCNCGPKGCGAKKAEAQPLIQISLDGTSKR